MRNLTLLFVLACGPLLVFGQFKKTIKTTPTQNVAQLIGAEIADNEKLRDQPSDKYQGFAGGMNGLRSVQGKLSDLKVQRDAEGRIVAIEGKTVAQANARRTPETVGMEFLKAARGVLLLKDPQTEMYLTATQTDNIGQTHLRYQQYHRGVPVFGAEVLVHLQGGDEVYSNGQNYPTPDIQDITPNFNEASIAEIVHRDLGKQGTVRMMGMLEKKLLHYEKPQSQLVIYHKDNHDTQERLAYTVMVRPNFVERWQYVIDANTGEILDKYNHTCSIDGPATARATDLNGLAQTIGTYNYQNKYYLMDTERRDPSGNRIFKPALSIMPDDPAGAIWTIDAVGSRANDDNMTFRQVTSTNNTWASATAVSAHYNATASFEYYRTRHARNSLNGKGGTVVSIINITDEDGKGFDNAFWNGEFMGYGNGRDDFKPLAGGLDVAGHEMTHGVIENTANLQYQGQSGAINESMADVFGTLIDRDDWTLGEDVVKRTAYPSGFMRSLSDPNNGGSSLRDAGYQPKNMGQYYTGSQDNYGVHINSGIPNHAYYLFANNASVGKDKAEKVYYRALTTYLTRSSKFVDLRLAIAKATSDLYGNGTELAAARAAFDAVGIADPNGNTTPTTPPPTPTTPTQNIPTNTGTEFLLTYDPVQKSLYVSNTAPKTSADFRAVVKNLTITHKPSVTDDGKFAYFVAADKIIKRVDLTVTNPTVTNVSTDAVWDNVAVSKDGKRLAALTTTADKAVYIFDLVSGKSKKYTLYNPTYSGVQTGQVQYADGIEWDYTGETLIYDAFNVLKNADGSNADFWDVGFIDVWSTEANNFGTGEISKLFTDLENGESIGNPSFSKTSGDILGFDYYSEETNENYLLGVNIETNKVGTIVKTTTAGYPDYSRQDNRMVFNTVSGTKKYTSIVALKTDKISGGGSASQLIEDSQYAVWYASGSRVLPTKQSQSISFGAISDRFEGSAPIALAATASSGLAVSYVVTSGNARISGNTLTITGLGKIEITAFQEGNTNFFRATPVTISFTVLKITATEKQQLAQQIEAYPNPAQEVLLVQLPQGITVQSIALKSAMGVQLLGVNPEKNNLIPLNISNLPIGVYLLEVQTEETKVLKKVVKQ